MPPSSSSTTSPSSNLTIPEQHLQPPPSLSSSSAAATTASTTTSSIRSSNNNTSNKRKGNTNNNNNIHNHHHDPSNLVCFPTMDKSNNNNDDCPCPHLEAYLPTFLDSNGIIGLPTHRVRGSGGSSSSTGSNLINHIHFDSLFNHEDMKTRKVKYYHDPNKKDVKNEKTIMNNNNNNENNENKNHHEQMLNMAITKVEHWLEVIRFNRHRYWEIYQKEKDGNEKNQLLQCKFCVKRTNNSKNNHSTNKGERDEYCHENDNDTLMECLDCSLIACGGPSSRTLSSKKIKMNNNNNNNERNRKFKSKQHIIQHFLISNHSLGMTCGPNGYIYCSKCGDFVTHPVLEREKVRVDVALNAKWLSWDRNKITQRSFGFSFDPMNDFMYVPSSPTVEDVGIIENQNKIDNNNGNSNNSEKQSQPQQQHLSSNELIKKDLIKTKFGKIVWRGFRALYPTDISPALIEAGQTTYHRLREFRRLQNELRLIDKERDDQKAVALSSKRNINDFSITCPVGLYNMGNTCYFGCVLQCLLNLHPIQKYFLSEGKHDHRSCKLLRSHVAKKKKICIGCEIDKLLLEYYGNVCGLDMRNALQRSVGASSDDKDKLFLDRGLPISPTNLLIELWKCKSMSLLAGYEQRDAHEFLQVMLDILSKDCRQFHSHANAIRKKAYLENQVESSAKDPGIENDGDIVTDLFQGFLRSVLICEQCGFKRSQKEAFLNISIPLDKEVVPVNDLEDNVPSPIAKLNNRIDLKPCLEKFVSPERLSEPVDCQWCKAKTSTKKQHTFAKLPKLLCLHLKRFDAASNRKIDDLVTFPKELNMGPYIPHW